MTDLAGVDPERVRAPRRGGGRSVRRGAGLPWSVARMGCHVYYAFAPTPARNAIESRDHDDPELRALIRVWMANRGVWESGWWLGPTVSVAHTAEDVDTYVGLFRRFLSELATSRRG